jgi:hypothetical protein
MLRPVMSRRNCGHVPACTPAISPLHFFASITKQNDRPLSRFRSDGPAYRQAGFSPVIFVLIFSGDNLTLDSCVFGDTVKKAI